jgi:amidohydrolase
MAEEFRALGPAIQGHRRRLHEIPELGFEEWHTSAYIKEQLDSLGIGYRDGIGGTGIVAYLGAGRGVEGGAGAAAADGAVAIRADIDGLPIQEEGDAAYRSAHQGKMHACGHDAHTAMLLGAAQYLKSVENSLPGEIRLVFQPSEERSDGKGRSGARHILDSGLLEGTKAILGAHMASGEPAGKFGIVDGAATASGDMFKVRIQGKGGHDAFVHQTIDPIFLAVQSLNSVYAIRSRNIDPVRGGTLSIGTISAGTTANVIPEALEMTGTIRTFDPETRKAFVQGLERAFSVADALGGSHVLEIPFSIPETRNDPRLAELARQSCAELFGSDSMYDAAPMMGVEDFSWYSRAMPALFIFIGASLGDGQVRPFHNPKFDIDDSILHRGSALLVSTALKILVGDPAGDSAGAREGLR